MVHPPPQAVMALQLTPAPNGGSNAKTLNVPFAPPAHCARPVEETVTAVVERPLAHAPQEADCGVTIRGAALQCPVAVNCTGCPCAVALSGETLIDCNSRPEIMLLPVPHAMATRETAGKQSPRAGPDSLTTHPRKLHIRQETQRVCFRLSGSFTGPKNKPRNPHSLSSFPPLRTCDTEASMSSPCPRCGGAGARVIAVPGGGSKVETCLCQIEARVSRLLHRAAIPTRYEHCALDSYEASFPGADRSLSGAHLMARRFVDGYPATTAGRGLLLTGSIGVGKTHLAVGILQALILEKSVNGLFCDYRELLKQIQHSYNPQVATTEMEILQPVFDAEVLVLDELGAAKPTDWVWDTVALVLNTRYNDKRTTIITTNYADQPPGGSANGSSSASRALRDETLGDRIGERMRSRLAEMCVVVEMRGEDFRRNVARARFG